MNVAAVEKFIPAKVTKQDRSRMRELTELAYIVVFDALKLEHGEDRANSQKERKRCSARAEVSADYLFGREPDQRTGRNLDLAREQEAAREWLMRNAQMRELVLESLRILNVLNENKQSQTGPTGEGLLMAYGGGSFRAFDLETYDIMVHDAIFSLPLQAQQSIFYGWAKTQSCH